MIRLPAYFTGYRRRKDRSASLSFVTQEISSEELKQIDELVMTESFGWLLFKENEMPDIPEEDAENDDDSKSPSKRLYNRMFVYWKEKGIEEPFSPWRENQLEKFGQRYLDKLD